MTKTVWVVLDGRSDSAYDLAEEIKRKMERESDNDLKIRAEIIEDHQTAIDLLEDPARDRPSVITFVSSHMLEKARAISKKYGRIEVLVLTEVLPEGEVAIIPSNLFLPGGIARRPGQNI